MNYSIAPECLRGFGAHLRTQERAQGTVERYLREAERFIQWLEGREVSQQLLCQWKERLLCQAHSAGTVNGALSALHSFFAYLGWKDLRVQYLRIQRRVFREESRELTREEYNRLVQTALTRKKERLALVLESICATGVRVSEVQYLTVEAARLGRADISLKGKIRTVLIPGKLCRKLLKYARKQKIASGEIFRTGSGKPLSRRQIWGEMKALCSYAGVDHRKVFPHNLRHLFARCFYQASRDIVKLADVLGHSSVETTRIYLISTGEEHARQLEMLGFVT